MTDHGTDTEKEPMWALSVMGLLVLLTFAIAIAVTMMWESAVVGTV